MEKLKNKKFAFRVSGRDLKQIRIKAKRARMTVTDYLVTSALNKDIVVIDGVDGLISQMKLSVKTSISSPRWRTWAGFRLSDWTRL